MGLLLFYPFFELVTLFLMGRQIGIGPLFFYLLVSFIVGANLIRSAGFNTLKMSNPATVLEAPFRLMAGVLILVPGLISDILALLILIPIVRKVLWAYVFARFFQGRFYQTTFQYGGARSSRTEEDDYIDVDFVREERDVTPPGIDARKDPNS